MSDVGNKHVGCREQRQAIERILRADECGADDVQRLIEATRWPCWEVQVAAVRALEWVEAEGDEVFGALMACSASTELGLIMAALSALRSHDRPEVQALFEEQSRRSYPRRLAATDGIDSWSVVCWAFEAHRRRVLLWPGEAALMVAVDLLQSLWPRDYGRISRFEPGVRADGEAMAAWLTTPALAAHLAGSHDLLFCWSDVVFYLDDTETDYRTETWVRLQPLSIEGQSDAGDDCDDDDCDDDTDEHDLALPSIDAIAEAWRELPNPPYGGKSFMTLAAVTWMLADAFRAYPYSGVERKVFICHSCGEPIFAGWLGPAGYEVDRAPPGRS